MKAAQKHEEKVFESVWDALCDTEQEACNMRLRAQLLNVIQQAMQSQGLTQAQAARLCGVTAPRMSDLAAGRISKFSLDALVNIAAAMGLHLALHAVPQELEVAG